MTNRRKVVAGLLALGVWAAMATPAQAIVDSVGFYKTDVSTVSPLLGYVNVVADTTPLHVRAVGSSKGFTLTVSQADGTVLCSMHSNRYLEAFCTIQTPAPGRYLIEVTAPKPVAEVEVSVTGDIDARLGV